MISLVLESAVAVFAMFTLMVCGTCCARWYDESDPKQKDKYKLYAGIHFYIGVAMLVLLVIV